MFRIFGNGPTMLGLALAGAIFAPGSVRAQHSDVEITVEGGRLVADPRVAEGEFGEAPNPANLADEPGIDVEDGIFNAGELLGFNVAPLEIAGVSRHLWFWDGTGSPTFGAVSSTPAVHELTIEHPLLGSTVTLTDATGATMQPGFLIGQADALGGVHQDLDFLLLDPVGTDILPPADGVYLFGLEMTSPSYLPSEPVYFVLASGVDEMVHEAAVDYVTTTFNVPEPASAAWGCMVLALLGTTRRRRTA